MKHIAIVTGASSGIGREFVRTIPKHGTFDEVWVIARNQERLEELQWDVSIPLKVVAMDLSDPASFVRMQTLLEEQKSDVRLLINAAGFGRFQAVEKCSLEDNLGMIDLNCKAAVRLVNACLPFLGEGSHVVNICSTAAFQPFQKLNIYAASKAFLLRYTRALRMELLPRKIMVTAVCPYWIRDTEFIEKAETSEGSAIRSYPLSSRVSSVAALSLAGIRAGLPVVTPGIVCTLHRLFSKLLPDTVLQYIWEGIRRI